MKPRFLFLILVALCFSSCTQTSNLNTDDTVLNTVVLYSDDLSQQKLFTRFVQFLREYDDDGENTQIQDGIFIGRMESTDIRRPKPVTHLSYNINFEVEEKETGSALLVNGRVMIYTANGWQPRDMNESDRSEHFEHVKTLINTFQQNHVSGESEMVVENLVQHRRQN